tara:strand:- start:5213 stop:5932 length:720 start_codon:yes stop_codon:yes gene_type:complete
MEAERFILFGTDHLITLLIVVLATISVPFFFKNTSSKTKDLFGYGLAFILLIDFLAKPYYWSQMLDDVFVELLPLHMCSLSEISIAIYLFVRKKIFYEVSFFWGIGGGVMALLQPDTQFSFPDAYYVAFFLSHGAVWLAISFASCVLRNRPTVDSLKRVFIVSCVSIVAIYVINWMLGPPANYWFLGAKPAGASIMDLMPEPPRHIPIVVTLALIIFGLIYLPFWIYDRLKSKNAVFEE